MQTVAQGWLVLQLTHSAFQVGLVTTISTLPVLLFTLYGGVVADRVNKRRFLLVLQSLMLLEALALAVLTATGRVTVGWVMVLAAAQGLFSAFEIPARQSFLGEMTGREDLMTAIALGCTVMDLVLADRGNTGRVTFGMSEEDVQAALKHPLVSLCTDSGTSAEDGIFSRERSHPRAWASTARILALCPRGRADHAGGSGPQDDLPAGFPDAPSRPGLLRPGMAADIAAFDPGAVRERSTYADPNHYSQGFEYVAVNGELVLDGGRDHRRAARPADPRPRRPGRREELSRTRGE